MKKTTYNLVCIVVSVLFLLIMGVLFGGALLVGIWSAVKALHSGYGIAAAIMTTLPYALFCLIPGVLFYGCFEAFREFLKKL